MSSLPQGYSSGSTACGRASARCSAGRAACERYELQFLDDTVSVHAACAWRATTRAGCRIARTYTFEFSDTGNNRRHGAIVMLGGELQDLQLEPYRIQ